MEDTAHTLSELGLNKIQIKLLLTLCRFDYISVKDLSKETSIHRAQIYTALEELKAYGLIEKEIGKPIQYRAIQMSKILDILLRRKVVWMSDLQEETKDLIKKVSDIEAQRMEKEQEDYTFTLINGVENAASMFRRWIENSRTVDFVVNFKRYSPTCCIPGYIEEIFRGALCQFREDVKVRLVTSSRPEIFRNWYWEGAKNLENRFVSFNVPMDIGVFNKERASLTIYTKKPDMLRTDMSVLTSNHPSFVQMVQNHFDLLWNNSTATQEANDASPK
ncbi:MAG: TrmB family transcriptional regulator [Candidatus Bathyarchaeia archaeon]|jgi:sugar-specific transcriptional regulator TrmB